MSTLFKKGQMKMMETIGILFVFMIILALVMIFFIKTMRTTTQIKIEETFDVHGIEVAQRAAFLPELQCTINNVGIDNCFDTLKMEAFRRKLLLKPSLEKEYYFGIFGKAQVYLYEVYPIGEPTYAYGISNNNYGLDLLTDMTSTGADDIFDILQFDSDGDGITDLLDDYDMISTSNPKINTADLMDCDKDGILNYEDEIDNSATPPPPPQTSCNTKSDENINAPNYPTHYYLLYNEGIQASQLNARKVTQVPVLLFHPESHTFNYGVLEVVTYR